MIVCKTVKDVIRLIQDEISYQYDVADVAESAGVSYMTVKNIVNGKTKSPHFRTILAILKAMQYKIQVQSETRGRRLPIRRRMAAVA